MIVTTPNVEQFRGASTQRGTGVSAQAGNAGATPVRERPPVESAESARMVIAAINRAAKSLNNSVQLSLDAQSGRAIVRVVDSETGQLIRQIPNEEVFELRRALDRVAGLLIRQKA